MIAFVADNELASDSVSADAVHSVQQVFAPVQAQLEVRANHAAISGHWVHLLPRYTLVSRILGSFLPKSKIFLKIYKTIHQTG